MTHPAYERIEQMRKTALEEVDSRKLLITGLVSRLKAGVSFEEGVEIVNRFWEPREAQELKTKLFNNFPQENGSMILSKGLDERVGTAMKAPATEAFFTEGGEMLKDQIQAILNHINNIPVQDGSGGVIIANLARANIAKFLGYIGWGVYEIRRQLLCDEAPEWERLEASLDLIESGDYLFLEDLGGLVAQAMKDFVEREMPSKWDMSLGGLEYRFGTIDATMTLTLLFAQYLYAYPMGE